MVRNRILQLVLLSLLWSACTGKQNTRSTLEHAHLRQVSRIGAVEGKDALTEIMGVAAAPDGDLYVTEWQVPAVTVFGPGGSVRRTIGRGGLGPGEFTQPGAMGFLGDTLWVQDRDGVSLFTAAGRFLSEVRFRRPMRREGLSYSPERYMRGGVLIGQVHYPSSMATRGELHVVPILALSTEGTILDTLAEAPIPRVEVVEIQTAGHDMFTRMPELAATRHAFSADGSELVVLNEQTSDASHGELKALWLSPRGDTLSKWVQAFTPQPLRAETKDAILKRLASSWSGWTGIPAARIRAEADAQIPWPQYEPSYTAVVVGADQRLWLKRSAVGDSARWEVWSAHSGPGLEVWAPRDLDIKYADSVQVWGVRKDAMDVPFLYQYQLVGPNGQR